MCYVRQETCIGEPPEADFKAKLLPSPLTNHQLFQTSRQHSGARAAQAADLL